MKRSLFKSLHGKVMLQTLFIGLLPVIVVGTIAYLSLAQLSQTTQQRIDASYEQLATEVVGANLSERAAGAAKQLDNFMRERIADAIVWTTAPVVIGAARGAAELHRELDLVDLELSRVEARFSDSKSQGLYPAADVYLKQQIARSPHFGEAFFTDVHGYNVALTNPTSDFVQSDEIWWREAWRKGIDVGQVQFDDSAGIWSVEIAVRIDDPLNQEPLGVLKAVLGVSLIQEVADNQAQVLTGGSVSVATAEGQLLAETSSQHAQDRIMSDSANLREDDSEEAKQIFGQQRQGFILGQQTVSGFARSAGADFFASVAKDFQGFSWVVVVRQPREVAFAPIAGLAQVQQELTEAREQLAWVLLAAVGVVAVISMMLANMISRSITVPLIKLSELADMVSRGDTSRTIEVKTDDEIRDLAEAFERMRKSVSLAIRKLRDTRTHKAV